MSSRLQPLVYNTFPKKDNSEDNCIINENGEKLCSVCRQINPNMCLRSCEHWIHFGCCNASSYRDHVCEICGPISVKEESNREQEILSKLLQYNIDSINTKFDGWSSNFLNPYVNLPTYYIRPISSNIDGIFDSNSRVICNRQDNHGNDKNPYKGKSNREIKRDKTIHQKNKEQFFPKSRKVNDVVNSTLCG